MHENNLTEGNPQRQLIVAWIINATRKRKNLRSRAFLGTNLAKPLSTVGHNQRNIGQGFHIVHNCGFAIKTKGGREGWAQTGLTQFSFNRFQQGGFFTANVCTSAQMGVQAQGVICTKKLITEQAGIF